MARLSKALLALAAFAAVIVLSSRPAVACSAGGLVVGDQLNPTLPTPTFNADETYQRYSVSSRD
jgi:hypothetical protein